MDFINSKHFNISIIWSFYWNLLNIFSTCFHDKCVQSIDYHFYAQLPTYLSLNVYTLYTDEFVLNFNQMEAHYFYLTHQIFHKKNRFFFISIRPDSWCEHISTPIFFLVRSHKNEIAIWIYKIQIYNNTIHTVPSTV